VKLDCFAYLGAVRAKESGEPRLQDRRGFFVSGEPRLPEPVSKFHRGLIALESPSVLRIFAKATLEIRQVRVAENVVREGWLDGTAVQIQVLVRGALDRESIVFDTCEDEALVGRSDLSVVEQAESADHLFDRHRF
jgi:hypothetical protein